MILAVFAELLCLALATLSEVAAAEAAGRRQGRPTLLIAIFIETATTTRRTTTTPTSTALRTTALATTLTCALTDDATLTGWVAMGCAATMGPID